MKYILSTKQASNILRDKTESFPRWQFFFAHLPTEIMRPKTFFFFFLLLLLLKMNVGYVVTLHYSKHEKQTK